MKLVALFTLVAFSIYTGCATTNTYRMNVSHKDGSKIVGKYVHVHHDMKEFPSPIEGTVGKSSTESMLVVFTAAQGKLEIPTKQIDRIEITEKTVDRTRTWRVIWIGGGILVAMVSIIFAWGFAEFYDSF